MSQFQSEINKCENVIIQLQNELKMKQLKRDKITVNNNLLNSSTNDVINNVNNQEINEHENNLKLLPNQIYENNNNTNLKDLNLNLS
jgi:hypothetical protein